jgi:acetyltransferase-like isoleucine patch superfamily enzyme
MLLIQRIIAKLNSWEDNRKYKNKAPDVFIPEHVVVSNPDNLILNEGAELAANSLIMNINAKVIFGRYAGTGPNLTIIAGNHMSSIGKFLLQVTDEDKKGLDAKGAQDQDVVLEDDVWVASNVTILNGVRIGRGAVVSAGTVVRSKIPPYAIVAGNPAKVVGFRFTPAQVLEHEAILYPEEERLPLETLEKNYKKYYLNRLKEINQYCRI